MHSMVILNLPAGITATEFIKYNGTYGGNIEGNLNANFGQSKVNTDATVTGKDSSKLQSALGSLRKEELEVQKLLRDCKDRFVPSACSSCPGRPTLRDLRTPRLNFV